MTNDTTDTTRMTNRRIAAMITNGEAIDLTPYRQPDGTYLLPQPLPKEMLDRDFCAADTEQWIWSIGRNLRSGEIRAAHDARYYQNPDYECLWLR